MEQFKGKLVTIIDIVCFMDKTFYNIKEDTMNFFWIDEMFECKVYDTLDEFWDDWKNEKVGIKLNNSFEFIDFINNYHYKHFNIDLSTAIEDMNNYTIIKYGRFNDEKWNYILSDKINNYNVITYDDFIKLVEKDEKLPKNDQKSNSQILQNTPEYSVFQSKNSNKNDILFSINNQINNIINMWSIKDGNYDIETYNKQLDIVERLLKIKERL